MTTKASIIDRISAEFGFSKRASKAVVEKFTQVLKDDLHSAGHALIPGVGKLVTSTRNARQGRNPRTGAPLQIEARRVVRLRPSAGLKREI